MATILINDTTPRNQYTATASQTIFTYAFEIFEDSDIVVDQNGTILTLTTHYTVQNAGVTGGGTITLVTGATVGDIITIYRDVPTERLTDYQTSGDFLAETVNDDFDRIITMIQQTEEVQDRSLIIPINDDSGLDPSLPAVTAGYYLAANTAGTAMEWVSGVPAATTVTETQTSGTSQTVFTLTTAVYAPGSNNLTVYVDGVYQNPSQYVETSSTVVTFGTAVPDGIPVTFVVNVRDVGSGVTLGTNVTYQYNNDADTRTVTARLQDTVSVLDFGADPTGAVDAAAAFESAFSSGADTIHVPDGTYLISGNFQRPDGITVIGRGQVSVGGNLITLDTEATHEDFTVYVGTTGDDTANHGLSATYPFATLQRAWDSLPTNLRHNCVIQLADGTYNSSTIAAADQPRPAILWGKGKTTTTRSFKNGSDIDAAVSIRGNSGDNTAVKIETTVDYTYGVYVNKGNIGIQDLTIKGDGTNSANSLLVAHRTDTYLHVLNCIIDGVSTGLTTNGCVAESGGQIENVGTEVKRCATGMIAFLKGDNITHTHDGTNGAVTACTTGVNASRGGTIELQMLQASLGDVSLLSGNTVGANVGNGSTLYLRGQAAGSRVLTQSPINLQPNGNMEALFVAIKSIVTASNSRLQLSNSDYQAPIILNNSQLWLKTTNSYVSPATANDANRPVEILYGSSVYYSGTNNINGASGGYASRKPTDLTYTANSQVKAIDPDHDTYRITGSTAARTGCEIDATNIEEGRVIYVDGDTWGVQLIGTGTHMEFDTAFYIGTSTGQYSGAIFVMRLKKWRLVGRGEVRV